MGAHLCDGHVENNSIRCPFHFWKFSGEGICEDIPALSESVRVEKLGNYKVSEKYGLIWIWYGDSESDQTVPVIPELQGLSLQSTLGKPFVKECHPNVMMINAIDAHHFKSVHKLVVDLVMEPTVLSPNCIQFSNTTPMPKKNWFLNWASRFYAKALTYELTYWWGHTGSVMVGPDFLHFYIIFALRPNSEGKAEGQTILVTRQRPGFFGYFFNKFILYLTKLVGNYFQVFTYDLVTGQQTQLTSGNFNYLNPKFSPDGKWIVFDKSTRKEDLKPNQDNSSHIFIMNLGGGNVKQLTTGKTWNSNPEFGSDGYIYFSSNAGNSDTKRKFDNYDIWRVKPNLTD